MGQKLRLAGVSQGCADLGFLEGESLPCRPRTLSIKSDDQLRRNAAMARQTAARGAAQAVANFAFEDRRPCPFGSGKQTELNDGDSISTRRQPKLDDGSSHRWSSVLQEYSH